MKKEFNLSEKINKGFGCIGVKNVKEFIRLRDGLDRLWMLGKLTTQEHADECEKLAGKELVK